LRPIAEWAEIIVELVDTEGDHGNDHGCGLIASTVITRS
jgi:hypothetical protein